MPLAGSSATRLSLISRIRIDDAKAWQELVSLYSPLVAFWCRKRGIDESEINDLIQDVFFAVARSIDDYRPRGESGGFRAWLWTITRNKIIDSARKGERIPAVRGGSTALTLIREVPETLDEEDASEKTEFTRLLHRALEQVRCEFEAKSWQAFWRCTIDGLPTAAVAQELAVSPAAVRQYRSRVLRRLRQQMGEQP